MRRGAALVVGIAAAVAAMVWLRHGRPDAPSSLEAARSSTEPAPAAPTLAARPAGSAPRAGPADAPTASDPTVGEPPRENAAQPRELALRVLLVDAISGERLDGAWYMGSPLYAATAALRALLTEDGRPRPTDGFVPAGEARRLVLPVDPLRFELTLRLPPDRCRWDRSETVQGFVAEDAEELLVVVPVYRAIPLRLTVRGPDGRLAEGAEVAAVTVGGRRSSGRGSATAGRELEVPVPFLPGEEARVALDWSPNPDESLAAEALTPEESISDPEWKGPVPPSPWQAWTAEVRLKGPCGHIEDHTETDFDHPTEEALFEEAGNAPTRSVTVHATDREGAPVTGAEVMCQGFVARTDAAGAAVFEKVRPGTRHFAMSAAGRLSRSVDAKVPSDGESVVELREPRGAILEVVVVGEDERPRPFAEVTPAAAFFDTAGAVQRLDPYTDALGRRTFSRVQPGKTVVRAAWAGHKGHGDVALVDGERTRVRIVVK